MKNKYLCAFLGTLSTLMVGAQVNTSESGTDALSGAEMYALLPGSFQALNNPGFMQRQESVSISLYQELPYALSDFSKSTVGIQRQKKSKAMGMALVQSGNSYLNEQVISFAWATVISKKLNAEIALQWHSLHRHQESNTRAVIALLGLTFELSPQVRLGITMNNPTRQHFTHMPDLNIPIQNRIQLSYAISKELYWLQGICMYYNNPLYWQFGLHYKHENRLNLLAGLVPAKGMLSAGISLVHHKTTFSLAFKYSNSCGYWPATEINYLQ